MNEQQKKQEKENFLKWNAKKKKIKQEKEKAKKAQQQKLLEPKIENNLLTWTDKYKNGSVYEGKFGEEKCFEIKRGILIFQMKIVHEDIKIGNNSHTSINIVNLQIKANKILLNNPKFLLKFKPVS
jgi:flagellar biosynthesis component FlhA